jgi:hypothetical protein
MRGLGKTVRAQAAQPRQQGSRSAAAPHGTDRKQSAFVGSGRKAVTIAQWSTRPDPARTARCVAYGRTRNASPVNASRRSRRHTVATVSVR